MTKTNSYTPGAYELRALEALRNAGLRITGPRVQVIRTLEKSPKAMSAQSIHQDIVHTGNRVDLVSVYRILGTLVELNLVHHIGMVDGYMACGLPDCRPEDTEHLVCAKCGKITEVQVPLSAVEDARKQIASHGFQVQSIKIEVRGECKACSAS